LRQDALEPSLVAPSAPSMAPQGPATTNLHLRLVSSLHRVPIVLLATKWTDAFSVIDELDGPSLQTSRSMRTPSTKSVASNSR